ncbi:MAG: TolC family outer membrane protein [Pseudomonadota bacterium]
MLRHSVLLAAGLLSALHGSAAAESLVDALKAAYRTNPALKAEQARQRATDEQVPQAKAGMRPNVIANADAGVRWNRQTPGPEGKTNPASVGITLTQPVFDGFRTKYAVGEAQANVEAGRQNLLAVEQQILLEAATAYMDALRDSSIVKLRRRNIRFLQQQLAATLDREAAGEITRTDLAQARSRLALAHSEAAQAELRLAESGAVYKRVTGSHPKRLKHPKLSRRVPKSLKSALRIASRLNPAILAAAYTEDAARQATGVAKSALLPQLNFEARAAHSEAPSSTVSSNSEAQIGFRLSVPLYQGGRVHSQVRQSKQIEQQRRFQVQLAQRQVHQIVEQAWAALLTATKVSRSASVQVRQARTALEGVKEEAGVGARTTLDILDAESELVLARITLAAARRDRIVAGYQLVAAIGKMTAAGLGLSVARYDPARYYLRVRDKAFGTSIDTE